MTAILPRLVADRQPRGTPRINKSHPLARGLVLAAVPSLGLRNVVTNATMAASSSPIKAATPKGIAWDVQRGTVNPITTDAANGSSQSHSYFAMVNMTNLGTTNQDVFISNMGGGLRGGFDFGLVNSASGTAPNRTFNLRTVHDGVASFSGAAPVSGMDGAFGSIGFAHGSGIRHYANGQLLEVLASTPQLMNLSSNPIVLHENVYWPYGPLQAKVAVEFYWTRELSAAEMAAVHANPWQLFESESPRNFASLAISTSLQSIASRAILPRYAADRQPQNVLRANRNNPYGRRLHQALTPTLALDQAPITNRPRRLSGGPMGLATNGGANGQISTSKSAPILGGRAAGLSPDNVDLTFIIVASEVGLNSWIYDGQEPGGTGFIKKDGSGNLVYGDGTSYNIGAPWPSTAKVCIFHTGRYGGSIQPQAWFDGVPAVTTNSTPGDMGHFFQTPPFKSAFGSLPYPTSNMFVGKGYLFAVLRGLVTAADVAALTANPWQLFESESPSSLASAAAIAAALASYRALIWNGYRMAQITDAQLGTSLKPLVLVNGQRQQRVASEGLPLVLQNGILTTLPANSTLLV